MLQSKKVKLSFKFGCTSEGEQPQPLVSHLSTACSAELQEQPGEPGKYSPTLWEVSQSKNMTDSVSPLQNPSHCLVIPCNTPPPDTHILPFVSLLAFQSLIHVHHQIFFFELLHCIDQFTTFCLRNKALAPVGFQYI